MRLGNTEEFHQVLLRLDQDPHNWLLRSEYASLLEEAGKMEDRHAQLWMIEHLKCPGPPCVQEALPSEATWFISDARYGDWSFPYFVEADEVDSAWCLPADIFIRLEGFIVGRRDGGFHNRWAKSWTSRIEAEKALALVLEFSTKGRKYRSIDDKWSPSGC